MAPPILKNRRSELRSVPFITFVVPSRFNSGSYTPGLGTICRHPLEALWKDEFCKSEHMPSLQWTNKYGRNSLQKLRCAFVGWSNKRQYIAALQGCPPDGLSFSGLC